MPDPRPLPPSPLTEWEISAVAARMVQREDCYAYIAAQVGRLSLLGDREGVATWNAVALKVKAIMDAPRV